jgi:N-terminal double-transmembrane domain
MSFLFPLFLLALLAVSIPIIIHLFNFKRYKTVYFSNIQLLKRIKQESRKKSQLKQLLILLSRILAIIFLVLAFSRPYFPSGNRVAKLARQVVEIYIDNSFSMKAVGEKGPLLEQAKQKAIEIVSSYPAGTEFLIKTNDFIPGSQYPMNKDEFIRQVAEIKESPFSPMLADVYSQSANTIESTAKRAEKTLFVLTDFQKGNANVEAIKPDSAIWTYLIPFRAEKTNNLLIDSCWFEVPGRKIGQAEQLYVRIKNYSQQAYQNVPVRLTINDSLKAVSNVSIEAGQNLVQELNYTNNSEGIQLCKVELDDYPIIFDNSYYFSYQVRGKLQSLGITNGKDGGSNYLKALFGDDELIGYDEVAENMIQVSRLKNYQCIFLINNEGISSGLKSELASYVEDGGTLVIFPAKSSNYADYNALLASVNGSLISGFDTASVNISELNYNHALYHDVFKKNEAEADLPKIKGSVNFAQQMLNAETGILKFRNGKNALSAHPFGKGTVYTFAFPLSQANFSFVRHMIFVPTIYNMVLYSGEPQTYAYSTESEEPVVLNSAASSGEITLVNLKSKEEFRTSTRNFGAEKKQLVLDDVPKDAGHYLVKDGAQVLQSVSYNYPRKESVPEFLSNSDLNKILQSKQFKLFQLIENPSENLGEAVKDLSSGKQLWKYFIAMALAFLLCEVAIIRFWKN